MVGQTDREFGAVVTRLIRKENLSQAEANSAFSKILKNRVTDMHQGAFLAALATKGETEKEVAGIWEAIYELDTAKVCLDVTGPVVENSGTGMDTFKTYNISTAAAIIAAAGGVRMARHGARAITSVCGTVDMAEALGVDVECPVERVASSIRQCGIGLFNGMSPNVHPKALGRILSNLSFGSTLNIAASLANPALPRRAVRGVYAREMIMPVIRVMKAIGYEQAIVLHGGVGGTELGMDEASVCGPTYCAELHGNGDITEFVQQPGDVRLPVYDGAELVPATEMETEATAFVDLLRGKINGARRDAAILNAGFIFYVAGRATTIARGIEKAAGVIKDGTAFKTLESWVAAQNEIPGAGLEKLARFT